MPCLGENTISEFLAGALGPAQLEAAEAHLDACLACRRCLAAAAGAEPPPEALRPGSRVAGYVVEAVVGRGGMGAVYSAFEPDLQRRVALKVPAAGEEFVERFCKEAELTARVEHRNVVTIYRFGAWGSGLFIAMELIDGGTLRDWLEARRRETREVIQLFLQAAEGLAAAHRAGLVHRDFKPDNVLVGKGGRVCVSDFGIAGLSADVALQRLARGAALPGIAARVTRAGWVLGSPAYMAPEQMMGEPVEPRTDVFSFCVALHEALYGVRPFEGTTLSRLRLAVREQRLRTPSSPAGVPAALRAALLEGLRPQPADRPQLVELMATLRAHSP